MAGRPRHVVVVGGGITGLTAAYRLFQTSNGTPIDVTVIEAAAALGGKLRTGELDGIPIEEGADSFVVRKPWAMDLCRELGLGDVLVTPVPGGAYVWARGRLVAYPKAAAFGVPASVEELLRWPGLSPRARLRAATDLFRPARKSEEDESIRDLAARRLGSEAADTLVGPLLAGINAGDPARLDVAATFPELRTWERGHGSLIRGARAAVKRTRDRNEQGGPLFATVWSGLSTVVTGLASGLGPGRIRLGDPVSSLSRSGDGWVVETGGERLAPDAVILATPAFESSRLLASAAPDAARELAGIPYASTAVVSFVYPEGTAGLLPPGTGFIVPSSGQGPSTITACTWVSSKWPREEHRGRAVLRCYVGRDGEEGWMDRDDDDLVRLVRADVDATTPLQGAPVASRVVRWVRSMPQYRAGHLERVARIDRALASRPGIVVAGSAYRGVGIADCVRQGGEAAERVRRYLAGSGSGSGSGSGPGRAEPDGGTNVEQEAIT
jgi:protoporphyrinogen/coproporphyrinogen III oxidase